jgi:phosphatidate phosphatase APP1
VESISISSQIHRNTQTTQSCFTIKRYKTSLTNFVWTGRGGHNHKFDKIKHILEFYPSLKYVLIGDDSQHDPYMKP